VKGIVVPNRAGGRSLFRRFRRWRRKHTGEAATWSTLTVGVSTSAAPSCRAEEDTDAAGRIDKWETFTSNGAFASVAFDTNADGRPDERLVYGADGSADFVR